jgi:membrane-associated phospholipid phosphatase
VFAQEGPSPVTQESPSFDASTAPTLAAPHTATPRVRLRSNLAVDLAVTGALAAMLITWGVAIKPNLSAPSCTICDGPNGKVNAVDDFFRTTFKLSPDSPAGTVSDVFGYGVAPLTGVALAIAVPAHDGRLNEAPENLLLIVEATLTYAVLQQGLTALLPRERPAVHAEPSPDRESSLQRHSSLESFPGGHNGLAFAVAAAGGTVATLRGYRLAPLVWIVGGAIGFVTTYLRMAADRHYFTDLTAGAALGIGTGIAIPLLFHRPFGERPSAATRWLQGAMVSTTELPGGRVVGLGWGF